MIKIKILFIGCVQSSKILLESLIADLSEEIELIAVITKKRSDFNSDFCDLAHICVENSIEFIYADNINEEDLVQYIKDKKPDLIYCFGWSQLLSSEIIDIPNIGCVGFHPTKLPHNRGRNPIVWTLALGLEETASTFFFLEKDADNGDIISQEKIKVSLLDDASSLYNKILNVAKKQIVYLTKQFIENKIVRIKQQESEANIWRKRSAKDGEIDWRMSSLSIYNLVRALTKPYIGAHFTYNSKEYKVWAAELVDNIEYDYRNLEFGKVISVGINNSFIIRTGDGVIRIKKHECNIIREGVYI